MTGAREVADKCKRSLKEAKAAARKTMAGPRAMRIVLQADAILWALCKDNAARSPLIEASLWGLAVHTARYSDNSGRWLDWPTGFGRGR